MNNNNLDIAYKKIKILENFRDKCYVNNILCQKTCDYYNNIKTIMSFPLIFCTSIMTILNSSEIPSEELKYANIVINGITTIIIGLINNLKFAEKQNNFKILALKYNKLCHYIEDILSYKIEDISNDIVSIIVKDYDNLDELLEYSFPEHIKNNVRKLYINKKKLPNILNCQEVFASPMMQYIQKNKSLDFDDNISNIRDFNISFDRIKSSHSNNNNENDLDIHKFNNKNNLHKLFNNSFKKNDISVIIDNISPTVKDYNLNIKSSNNNNNKPKSPIISRYFNDNNDNVKKINKYFYNIDSNNNNNSNISNIDNSNNIDDCIDITIDKNNK